MRHPLPTPDTTQADESARAMKTRCQRFQPGGVYGESFIFQQQVLRIDLLLKG